MPEVHSYGWTPSPPDIRDRIYAASPHVLAALPPKVDLSQPPVFEQGSLGSCGPQSAAADIIFAALSQQRLPSAPTPSRLFIYYNTRQLMGTVNQDSGVNNRSLMKALAKFGWCDDELWPYNIARFKEKPAPVCYEQAAERKIIHYEAVPQDLQVMKAALASGDCFIFGFTVYSSMEVQSVAKSGDVPMPTSRDKAVGGHDVTICGYSDETQRFKFKNSWGKEWGNDGFGTIPFSYATNPRLAGDFWTVTHSALPDATPTPSPDDVPTEIDIKIAKLRFPSEDGGFCSVHFDKDILKELLAIIKGKP